MVAGGTKNRQVVLLKSRRTNNRFYTLVEPGQGLKNADTVDDFADDLLLGIAYPCLEDGLNDFAVIRTTYETLEQFPDDDELREEMMEIIQDASTNLHKRLTELRDRLRSGQAHFLGTDLEEFKSYMIDMVRKGSARKILDSVMKVNVFESVAEEDFARNGLGSPEPLFTYPLLPAHNLHKIESLPAREFVVEVFQDLLDAVDDETNYLNRYTFDKNVFQKFISIMFVNYATTDPIFYGTNKADYGVSADRDMSNTPLYIAIGESLRAIEAHQFVVTPREHIEVLAERLPAESSRVVEIPKIPMMDQRFISPITAICDTSQLLIRIEHPRAKEYGEVILRAVGQIVAELKDLGVLSPMIEVPAGQVVTDHKPR